MESGWIIWNGYVRDGVGQASQRPVESWPAGFAPGTLNLSPASWPLRGWLRDRPPVDLGVTRDSFARLPGEPSPTMSAGSLIKGKMAIEVVVMCWQCAPLLNVELVARVHLRSALDLVNDELVQLRVEVADRYSLSRYLDRFFSFEASGTLPPAG